MRLANAEWPGHIRELANTVEAGAIRASADGSAFVEPEHAFRPRAGATNGAPTAWHEAVRAFQRRLLQETLDAHDGNVGETARALGIARSYAYELVRQLTPPASRAKPR